jgi:hypothetical protein
MRLLFINGFEYSNFIFLSIYQENFVSNTDAILTTN